MNGILRALRSAVWQSLGHNVLDTAKAAAYSGMLMLFPAFLVMTTLLAVIPSGNSLMGELRIASQQVLPADTMSVLQSYFFARRSFSIQVLLSALSFSIFAGWGLMATLMAGFRYAYRLPRQGSRRARGHGWGPWERRLRALLLVPIALIPLSLASAIIIFGKSIEMWMIENAGHDLRPIVLLLWRMGRWALAIVTGTAVLGAVFHFGTNSREHWRNVLPGAVTATLLWFPFTLAFGVYVTRMADYTVIYGSLGTAIATLVWLYLSSYAVLLGAQLNGTLFRERNRALLLQRSMHRTTPVAISPTADSPCSPSLADAASEAEPAGRVSSLSQAPAQPEEMVLVDAPEMPRDARRS